MLLSSAVFIGVPRHESYLTRKVGLIMYPNSTIPKPSNGSQGDAKFSQRRRRMNDICKLGVRYGEWTQAEISRYRSQWIRNDNFVAVPQRDFLLCVLPKCGSTSWHKLVRDIREPSHVSRPMGWQDRQKNNQIAQELSPELGKKLLMEKGGIRALAVRHPFGKIISGWNQKLTRGTPYQGFLMEGYPHMQKYTSNKDEKHVMTFEDLADYLATYGHDYTNLDYHFLPMTHLCKPCLYPYNVVIKQETTKEDTTWVMQKLNVSELPWWNKGPEYKDLKTKNASDIIQSYFKNVKKDTIRKLMEIYFYDFALFGYGFDPDTLEVYGLT